MEQENSIRVNEFFVITKTARRTEVKILKDKGFISFSAYPGAGSFLSGVKAGDRHVWELNDRGEWVKVDDPFFRELRRDEAFLVLWFCFWVIFGIVLVVLALVGWVDWDWVIFPVLAFLGVLCSGPYRWVVSRVMRFLNYMGR